MGDRRPRIDRRDRRCRAGVETDPSWTSVVSIPGEVNATRGGPIAEAFAEGVAHVRGADVVVKLDADVSFEPDYFERLLRRFQEDPLLGLASGTCYEFNGSEWRPTYTTRDHVRGAVRAYRRGCLEEVSPLEYRMGWDTIDELKARIGGWKTRSFGDLPFFHHRAVGARDGSRKAWVAQGELAYYLAYRPSYLLGRVLFRLKREPAAVAMLWGYAAAAIRRNPRSPDTTVRKLLRQEQRLRNFRARSFEALGKTSDENEGSVRPRGERARTHG